MFIGFRFRHWVRPLVAIVALSAVVVAKSDAGKVIAAAGKGAWKLGKEKFQEVREERRVREQAYREYSQKT
jgi:hypothetical protein